MNILRTSIHGIVAAVFLGCAAAGATEFSERLASWQGGGAPAAVAPTAPRAAAPPQSTYAPGSEMESWPGDYPGPEHHCADCGPTYWGGYGCGSFCGNDCGGCCSSGCNTLVWARFEAILWWQEGRDLPPLVTTDPVAEPSVTAGILPDATILFGGGNEESDMSVGGRFDVGVWSDPRQCYGLGWRFFGLGNDGLNFNITSLDNPVLAIPIFDVTPPAGNNAVLIAYPGLRTGEINIAAESEIYGNDVYGRFLLCRDCINRWDFVTGWHFSRVNDQLDLRAATTVAEVGGVDPLGTETTFRDRFATRSEFHGGILGFMWERECGCFTTQLLARMAIGGIHEEVVINGSTTRIVPGQNPVVAQGGIFTAASNIGTFERTEFTAVTEVGVTCGYRVANCTELTLGYTFLYWHDLQRVGQAIDPATGVAGGVARPQFDFDDSGFWVQGLNLGFTREF